MNREHVLSAVAKYYDITVEQIKSPTRVKPLPEARQMVCYILKDKPKDEVAKLLNIDRSSVYHATDRMIGFMSLYTEMRVKFITILTQINEYNDNKINA